MKPVSIHSNPRAINVPKVEVYFAEFEIQMVGTSGSSSSVPLTQVSLYLKTYSYSRSFAKSLAIPSLHPSVCLYMTHPYLF